MDCPNTEKLTVQTELASDAWRNALVIIIISTYMVEWATIQPFIEFVLSSKCSQSQSYFNSLVYSVMLRFIWFCIWSNLSGATTSVNASCKPVPKGGTAKTIVNSESTEIDKSGTFMGDAHD